MKKIWLNNVPGKWVKTVVVVEGEEPMLRIFFLIRSYRNLIYKKKKLQKFIKKSDMVDHMTSEIESQTGEKLNPKTYGTVWKIPISLNFLEIERDTIPTKITQEWRLGEKTEIQLPPRNGALKIDKTGGLIAIVVM